MNKDDLFYFGYVAGKHGVDNTVRIKADVDDISKYTEVKVVIGEINKSLVPFPICKTRVLSKSEILFTVAPEFDATSILSCGIYLPISMLPKLKENQFYYHEIKGYKVVDEAKGEIGKIDTVLEYPHQDVFSILQNRIEILIPVVDEFITKVDKENKVIYITAPDGLIDLYLKSTSEEEE